MSGEGRIGVPRRTHRAPTEQSTTKRRRKRPNEWTHTDSQGSSRGGGHGWSKKTKEKKDSPICQGREGKGCTHHNGKGGKRISSPPQTKLKAKKFRYLVVVGHHHCRGGELKE